MTLPLFAPPFGPSTSGTSNEVVVRERSAQFGDGYEQRAEDGINSRPVSGRWSWAALSDDDADDVVDFLSTNALTGFRYTFPAELVERKFRVVGSISRSYLGGGNQTISVQVREIFDP